MKHYRKCLYALPKKCVLLTAWASSYRVNGNPSVPSPRWECRKKKHCYLIGKNEHPWHIQSRERGGGRSLLFLHIIVDLTFAEFRLVCLNFCILHLKCAIVCRSEFNNDFPVQFSWLFAKNLTTNNTNHRLVPSGFRLLFDTTVREWI